MKGICSHLIKNLNTSSPLVSPKRYEEEPHFRLDLKANIKRNSLPLAKSPHRKTYSEAYEIKSALHPKLNSHISAKSLDSDNEENHQEMPVIKLNEIKGPFESKNAVIGYQNASVIEIKEIRPGNQEAKSMGKFVEEDADIRARNEDRDPFEVELENKNKTLNKAALFGIIQNTLPKKPKKLKRPKVVSISIFEYMISFVSRSKSTKEKMAILYEGLDALNSRLDIFNMLKKLRDLDKVKSLIFDPDQLFLFNQLPRPELMKRVNHWFQEEYLSYYEIFKKSNEFGELKMKDQIITSRRRIQEKHNKTEIDDKLLHLTQNIENEILN